MDWTDHSKLSGLHAILSPSNYHWTNYDDEKMEKNYFNKKAAERGVLLHDFAQQCIKLNERLPKNKKTLNLYVNDAIDLRMRPEQVLYYSPNCFGTADAISFRDNLLRIHDLKTGRTPASMRQLEIYAALFCLEYKYKPTDIRMELRLYQSSQVIVHEPTVEDIAPVIDKIISFDKLINKIDEETE